VAGVQRLVRFLFRIAFPNGVVFPIRIKLADDVSVQCPHDTDAKRMPHKSEKM
jgi:hypothetical protein